MVADPVLLEVQPSPAVRHVVVLDQDVGLDPVVGHRDEPDRQVPPGGEGVGGLGEGVPVRQQGRPDEVGADVEVAETEPGGDGVVRLDLGERAPGLVGAAPAPCLVVAAAQRVHDGVEIGGDAQAVEPEVVAGVADDRHIGLGRAGEEAAQETGGPDAAGQNGDPHDPQCARCAQPGCPQPDGRWRHKVRHSRAAPAGAARTGTMWKASVGHHHLEGVAIVVSETTKPHRELLAWVLLGAGVLLGAVAVISLVDDGTFTAKAFALQDQFASPVLVGLVVLAVILVSHVGELTPNARIITLVGLVTLAALGGLAVVMWVAALGGG